MVRVGKVWAWPVVFVTTVLVWVHETKVVTVGVTGRRAMYM
jgi:hypothetical protein